MHGLFWYVVSFGYHRSCTVCNVANRAEAFARSGRNSPGRCRAPTSSMVCGAWPL